MMGLGFGTVRCRILPLVRGFAVFELGWIRSVFRFQGMSFNIVTVSNDRNDVTVYSDNT